MTSTTMVPTLGAFDGELEAAADRLRRITVQVRTRGMGEGSGVIWSRSGLVVSNAHVARSNRLEVELWDGRVLEGRVRWRDPRRDLALLTIAASGLPTGIPGDLRRLRPGEIVLALGHPFGLANALSLGVIHRLPMGPGRDRWIRADIRLAPGNSGGPLANVAGEVIGLNTLVAGGLAYAIPVSAVQGFLDETGAQAA